MITLVKQGLAWMASALPFDPAANTADTAD